MFCYAMDSDLSNLLFILISGDRDFSNAICKLRLRGYNTVALIPSLSGSSIFSHVCLAVYSWNQVLQIPEPKELQPNQALSSMEIEFQPLIQILMEKPKFSANLLQLFNQLQLGNVDLFEDFIQRAQANEIIQIYSKNNE